MAHTSKINEPPSVDEVLNMLSEILGENAEEQWMLAEGELKYQGFNVVEFRKLIFSIKADKKEVTKDVTSMLRLFLIRGSKLSKIQKKTDKKTWTKYNTLLTTYKVKETVPSVGDDGTTVTLGRLSNAFPDVSAMLLQSSKKIRFPSIDVDLPNCFRFAGAASIIPSHATTLKQYHYAFCQALDDLLNAKKATALRASLDSLTTYWYASHKSELMDGSSRITFLKKLGVYEEWVKESEDLDEEDTERTVEREQSVATAPLTPSASKSSSGPARPKAPTKRKKEEAHGGLTKRGYYELPKGNF